MTTDAKSVEVIPRLDGDVLSHIFDYDNDYSKDLVELLPNNWAEKQLLKTPKCL